MSNRKKRSYISESRKRLADNTRRRIFQSAKKLFKKKGFEFVTIEELARAAKVSVPTVYALFQSKRGILRALMDEAFPTDQFEVLVEQGKEEKSAKKRLAITASIVRHMYDAERELMDLFRGASMLAPEFKELEKEREMRRYKRQEETVKALKAKKSLIKGMSVTKARDIVWAFTGRDMYRLFVIERGWSSKEYEQWLAQLLVKTVIGSD
ncbi:MAG TPA: TetR/AcrR family transcriptional regulator [Chlamydiales bacterium]|nr:TetR/AcrR family transcriptional regulator [Chlamydiales bacterium]